MAGRAASAAPSARGVYYPREVTRFAAIFPLLIASSALAGGPWTDLPEDPEAAWAQTQQEVLPQLLARKAAADARVLARQAWFDGDPSFIAAFPRLAGADLNSRLALTGLLAANNKRDVARAADRAMPLPPVGHEELLRKSLTQALSAEAAADGLERQLVVALLAMLDRGPGLSSESLHDYRSSLHAQIQQEIPPNATPEQLAVLAHDAAAANDELGELERLLASLRDQATRPSLATSYDPAVDITTLGTADGSVEPGALKRLRLVRSFLSKEDAERADSAEVAWLLGPRTDSVTAQTEAAESSQVATDKRDVERLTLELDVAEQALLAAESSVEALQKVSADEVGEARQKVAALVVIAETAKRDALRRQIGAADGELDADVAAVVAAQQAEQTRAAAATETEKQAAEVLEALADSQEAATAALAHVAAEGKRLDELVEQREQELSSVEGLVGAVERLVGKERPDPDEAYGDARELVFALRDDTNDLELSRLSTEAELVAEEERSVSERLRIVAQRGVAEGLTDSELQIRINDALEQWSESSQDRVAAARTRAKLVATADDELRGLLRRANTARRSLRTHIHVAQRRTDQEYLFKDLKGELSHLAPELAAAQRARMASLRDIPGLVDSPSKVFSAVRNGFSVVLLFGFWWMSRGYVGGAVRGGLHQLRRRGGALRPMDLKALFDPTHRMVVSLIDLVVGAFALRVMSSLPAVVKLVILVYLQVALVRMVMSVWDLAVEPHPPRRPSLRVVRADVYELGSRSVALVVAWGVARRFASFLMVDVLGTDALARLVGWGFFTAGVVLALWLAWAWEPLIRERVGRNKSGSAIVKALSTEGTWMLRPARAVAALAWLGVTAGWDLLRRLASRRQNLGRLLNVVSRYQVASEEEANEREPAPAGLLEALRGDAAQAYLPREGVEGKVLAAVSGWKKDGRRGLVAVIGDRGDGKRSMMDRLSQELEHRHRLVPIRWRLNERLKTREDAMRWLAAQAGISDIEPTQDKFIEQLALQLPGGIYVIEDAHLAFLRSVGGFGALQSLLYILNGLAEQHCWILTIHRPAWAYLSRLPSIVNVDVFRETVFLSRMLEKDVQDLTTSRLRAAGYRPRFDGLVRRNLLGGDPEMELDHATRGFFRLLAEASEGNPRVALLLFGQCLCTTDEDRVVDVWMHPDLSAAVLPKTSDPELFTLTALRTQQRLDERELVAVTNMSPGNIRAIVKHLVALGVVQSEGDVVSIVDDMLAKVTRTLRRRRFIPWEV
jgi:hypothetical protein